jgi:putative peptidoglycan lipid II flippase
MLSNMINRVLVLVCEQFAAGYFGAGDPIAAFSVADNLQTLVYDLMVSGASQAALISALAGTVPPDAVDWRDVRSVSSALVTWAMMGDGLLGALGGSDADQVPTGFVWISGDAVIRGLETYELTVRLNVSACRWRCCSVSARCWNRCCTRLAEWLRRRLLPQDATRL